MRPTAPRERSLGDLALALDLGSAPADAAVSITGVAASSADVVPGDLFVALQGTAAHGARYTGQAVRAGAAAVLTDAAGRELVAAAVADGTCPDVPVLTMPAGADPRTLLGAVAVWFYDRPGDALTTFAVTGTNGKTTTTYLLDHVLSTLGRTVGLIGTVETRSGDRVLPSRLTTPDAAALQGVLAVMREDHVDALAMEVSSHALVQHRVDGIVFDVAAFTNLSQDHLDFHGDLEGYFRAKAELFTPARARRGVVIVDSEWGQRLAAEAPIPMVTLRTADAGPASPALPEPDWSVLDVVAQPLGSAFTLRHRDGRTLRTATSLPGGFNVANAALALVMIIESGVDVAVLTAALDAAGGVDAAVPGRMEPVARDPRVIVDFAHNPDALGLAISALRPTTAGRLVVVFGATGERDTTKRPIMGAVAAGLADVVVVTDDDPHGEDASQIRQQVVAGARAAAAELAQGTHAGHDGAREVEVLEIAPRARAIAQAIAAARDEDTVLVAGRGHEVWQEINGVNHPLDDRVEARAAAAARRNDMMKELSK